MAEPLRKQVMKKAGYEPDEGPAPDFSDVTTGAPSQPSGPAPMRMPAMDISGAMPQTQAAPGAEPQPPSPPQVPPAPGPSLEEFQALQAHLASNHDLAHQIARARRSTMIGLGRSPEDVDEGKILAGLNGPLADMIQRQEFAKNQGAMQHQAAQTQSVAQGTQKSAQDVYKQWQDMQPGSPTNRARAEHLRQIAQQFGVHINIRPEGFTADQEQPIVRAIEAQAALTGHLAQARASLAETHEAHQQAAHHQTVEEGLRQEEVDRKTEAEAKKAKELKGPDKDKLDTALESLDTVEDLKKKHGDIGASGLLPLVNVGGSYDYEKAGENASGTLGKALYPTTRGTGAAELVRKRLPGAPSGTLGTRGSAFDDMHKQIYQNADTTLKGLEADPHVDQSIVSAYRKQLEDKAKMYGIHGAAQTHTPPPGFVKVQ